MPVSDLCLRSLPLPVYKTDSSSSGQEGDATPARLPQLPQVPTPTSPHLDRHMANMDRSQAGLEPPSASEMTGPQQG